MDSITCRILPTAYIYEAFDVRVSVALTVLVVAVVTMTRVTSVAFVVVLVVVELSVRVDSIQRCLPLVLRIARCCNVARRTDTGLLFVIWCRVVSKNATNVKTQ